MTGCPEAFVSGGRKETGAQRPMKWLQHSKNRLFLFPDGKAEGERNSRFAPLNTHIWEERKDSGKIYWERMENKGQGTKDIVHRLQYQKPKDFGDVKGMKRINKYFFAKLFMQSIDKRQNARKACVLVHGYDSVVIGDAHLINPAIHNRPL